MTDEMTIDDRACGRRQPDGPPGADACAGVAKTFGHGAEAVVALRNIDLHVEAGRVRSACSGHGLPASRRC